MFNNTSAMTRAAFILLATFGLLWANPLAGQSVDECDSPDFTIDDSSTDSTSFEVVEDDTIVELNIRLTLSTTFAGYMDLISVESPAGTVVDVHDGGGGAADDFNLTYTDEGRGNSATVPAPPFPAVQSAYDCGGCSWQPFPGELGDYDGESTSGEWTLSVTTTFANATVDTWCIVNYDLAPVEDLACTPGGVEGEWSLSWTNGDDYDSVEVRLNGEVVATEEDDTLAGADVTIDSTEALPVPQIARFDIVPIVGGLPGPQSQCQLALFADAVASVSTGPDYDEEFEEPVALIDFLTFVDDVDIDDISVRIDADGVGVGTMVCMLQSPEGTQVMLHQFPFAGPLGQENIDVTYWQVGVENGTAGGAPDGYDCNGCAMQPTSSLLSFAGESTIDDDGYGSWLLFMWNPLGGSWTLNEWGIDIYDVSPTLDPNINDCEVGETFDTGVVTFNPGSEYTDINIYVNGELVETLSDGPYPTFLSVTYTTEVFPFPSDLVIGVQGIGANGAPSKIVECGVAIRLPGLTGIGCVSTEYGVVDLSWVNTLDDYDGIDVYIDDEYVETLDGDATSASYSEYANGDPFIVESNVDFSLVAYRDGTFARPNRCVALLLEEADLNGCAIGGPDTLDLDISIPEFLTVTEVEALMDLTSGFFGGTDQDLVSPRGTTVRVHDTGGPTGASFRSIILWDDDGEVQDFSTDYSCACRVQPQASPMSTFAGEASDGEWSFITTSNAAFDPTYINAWCLRIYGCEIIPPADFTCTWTDDNEATLEWTNPDEYLADGGIEIYEIEGSGEEALVATLAGDETSYVIESLPTGYHLFRLQAMHPIDDCGVPSEVCRVAVNMYEQCEFSSFDFDGNLDDAILFVEPIQVGEVSVLFEYTGSFSPERVSLNSPSGTTVGLIDSFSQGLGASGNAISCIFNDSGVPFSIPAVDGGLRAPNVGSMADFQLEVADGEWVLDGTINAAFGEGDIDPWCLAIIEGCPTPPPAELECTWESGPDVTLTWTNFGDYSEITVLRNGEVIAALDGDTTEYIDLPGEADVYNYQIVGYDADEACSTGSRNCKTPVGMVVLCDLDIEDNEISEALDPVEAILTVDDLIIDDVECKVSISHPFIGQLTSTLENPAGDSITLHSLQGVAAANINVTYSDGGIVNSSVFDFDCDCEIQPFSGEMSDLAGDALGDWILTVEDSTLGSTGLLNEWCLNLEISCPIEAPTDLEAATTDGRYPVVLTWVNNPIEDYDGMTVLRDGEILAELDGDAETYTLTTGPGGTFSFRILAVSEENDCSKITDGVLVTAGGAMVCESPNTAFGGINPDTTLEFMGWDLDSLENCDGAFGEVVIADVEVQMSFTATFVSDLTWAVASPEGTTVALWTGNGGTVSWNSDDSVAFNDLGDPVPVTAPTDCTVEDCVYEPSGPVALSSIAGEDGIGEWLLVGSSLNTATLHEWCVHLFPEETITCSVPFLRGDVDGSGGINVIIDALSLLEWFAGNGDEPPCLKAADVDGNGVVNAIIDALRLLQSNFGSADDPPAPYPACGADADGLSIGVSCNTPPDC